MAPVATPQSAIDLRLQTLENCKFYSRQDATLSLVIAMEPLGSFKALVLRTEDGVRDVLLSETSPTLQDALYGIHAKSAAAVQNYISSNGFGFAASKSPSRLVVVESDEEDNSDTASVSSTVTIDDDDDDDDDDGEIRSPYESLSDNETVSVTSTAARLKKRSKHSSSGPRMIPSSFEGQNKIGWMHSIPAPPPPSRRGPFFPQQQHNHHQMPPGFTQRVRNNNTSVHPHPPPPPPPPPPPAPPTGPGPQRPQQQQQQQQQQPNFPPGFPFPNMTMMHGGLPPPPPPPPAPPAPSTITQPSSPTNKKGHDVLLHITWRGHGTQRVLETIPAWSVKAVKDTALAYVRRCPSNFGVTVSGVEKTPARLWGMRGVVKGVNVDGGEYDLSGWGGDDLRGVLGISYGGGMGAKGVVRFEVEVFGGGSGNGK
ncbi:hypothetical protein QBC38DRAFT_451191 [Podospora fimiseda]|uniref:Uncharacterized protein n=1 Tax=Podospora fimiseda TaxID=252190 RepID=A0AAN7BY67_9PEZI|nr:hypothetical protein QBC38DRAFT_451191 [Podospora fimiseda]